MSDITSKICYGCNKDLPFREYRPFPPGAFGLRPKCRRCEKLNRNIATELARKDPKSQEGTKVCRLCKEEKPRAEFRFNGGNRDRLDNACAKCYDGNRRASYQKNPVPHDIAVAKWRLNHPEQDRAIREAASAKFKKDNPLIVAAWGHTTYAIKTGRLKKTPCEICGDLEVEAHHPSHEQEHWLHVQFLCSLHHGRANKMKGLKYYTKELDAKYEERYQCVKVELVRCDDGTLGSTGR